MTGLWLALELALLALAYRQIERRLWLTMLLTVIALALALATIPPTPPE